MERRQKKRSKEAEAMAMSSPVVLKKLEWMGKKKRWNGDKKGLGMQ